MKSNSPRDIALFTGLVLAGLITALFVGYVKVAGGPLNLWLLLLCVVLAFAISYFLLLFAVERFVYKKIKLIYKTIHELKTTRLDEDQKLELDTVNREVMDWARDKRNEVKELRDQEKFRREFIGNLAHELKTPIFNVQCYLGTLLEGGLEDDRINRDYLTRADRSLDRLIDLVEDLDSVTKLESGRDPIHKERINIVAVAEEAFETLEMKSKESEINLRFKQKYERPIWVMADRSKILQVITNLVVNSIKYGRNEGGETEVRFFDMDKNILVEVADNGIGISEGHLNRLFERFYRVDKSRSRHAGGTGLGLAIAKHIIDAHQQSINVRSTEGVGSTFSFTLQKA
ncbi:MAG: sensor histidine kinase [Salibacteraceae bacterium]